MTDKKTTANAGPVPGDHPADRFIDSLPLPTYPATQQREQADERARFTSKIMGKLDEFKGAIKDGNEDWALRIRREIFDVAYEGPALTQQAAPEAPTQQAGTVVRYEIRIHSPSGPGGEWSGTSKEAFDRFTKNPDIGDGFAYECRALGVIEATTASASGELDQAAFEAQARHQGATDFESSGVGMVCENGWFPATYRDPMTELAWRVWANKSGPAALTQQSAADATKERRTGYGEGVRAAASVVEQEGNAVLAERIRDLQSWGAAQAAHAGADTERDAARYHFKLQEKYGEYVKECRLLRITPASYYGFKTVAEQEIDKGIAAATEKKDGR